MGSGTDRWAKDWLEEQRAAGKTGLTVEKKGNVHYLYWATTVWDKEAKKRKKIVEYRGVLDPDGTVGNPRPRRDRFPDISDVKESGNAKVLAIGLSPIFDDLRACFPRDHPEMIELAFARCLGRGELKKAGRCWKSLDDVMELRPNTDPSSLSETLDRVGRSRAPQDMFFERIRSSDKEVAVDLSIVFSRSRGAFLVKKGYNPASSINTQFNILMACGMGSGRPQYMKALAGNLREGSVEDMLDEFSIPEGTILVMDTGYCSEKIMKAVTERNLGFVVATRRESKSYDKIKVGNDRFTWKGNTVFYGSGKFGNVYAYRFENLSVRNEELATDEIVSKKTGKPMKDPEKAGNLMLLSSEDMEPREVYRLYKLRCTIENCFDTAKNVLSADRTYMVSDEKIAGHCFITFLSLCIWTEISMIIERAGLSAQFTVEDVLDTYASMKRTTADGRDLVQTVGKDVRELDAMLGLFLYSTQADRDKLVGEKRKKGRPPKKRTEEETIKVPKKRGRPPKIRAEPDLPRIPKKRGRPPKVIRPQL